MIMSRKFLEMVEDSSAQLKEALEFDRQGNLGAYEQAWHAYLLKSEMVREFFHREMGEVSGADQKGIQA